MMYSISVITETLPSAIPAWKFITFYLERNECSALIMFLCPRCSPCTSALWGLSAKADKGDLERCITGRAGSLNVIVSFPPATTTLLELLAHQLQPLCISDVPHKFLTMILKSTEQEKHLKWSFHSMEKKNTLYWSDNMQGKGRKAACFYLQYWVKARFWKTRCCMQQIESAIRIQLKIVIIRSYQSNGSLACYYQHMFSTDSLLSIILFHVMQPDSSLCSFMLQIYILSCNASLKKR